MMSPTGRRSGSVTASGFLSVSTPWCGSTPPTCRTGGIAAICSSRRPPPCSVVICSPRPGAENQPLVERDILGPSEAMRGAMDYFAHARNTDELLAKLAATKPGTLACMHGSSWRGNGGELLTALAAALA